MKLLNRISKLFQNIKHRRPSDIYCPRCCSPNIRKSSIYDTWLIPTRYICEKRGYFGPLFMELEKKEGESS